MLGWKFESGKGLQDLNSWGCRVGCAIPNGMVTDVHMSVGDAQQCSRPQKCKCSISRLKMPAVYKSVYYDLHVDMLIVTVVSDTLCPAKRLLFVANVCISQAR